MVIDDSIEYIKKYDLEFVRFEDIDLKNTCAQFRPGKEFRNLFINNGLVDMRMSNSPHYELSFLYYKNGLKWLKKNYRSTKYYKFKKRVLGKGGHLPVRKMSLFESLKNGYLSQGFENKYIVVLTRPLAETRYRIKCQNYLYPEIFMGHHRVGSLLCFNIDKVKVIVARDIKSGTMKCSGKLHNIYRRA